MLKQKKKKFSINLSDALDLHFFALEDAKNFASQKELLHRRDREIGIQSGISPEESSDSACFLEWLTARRADYLHSKSSLPGEETVANLTLFKILLTCMGIFTGSSMALSYLIYTGETPLNIFLFYTLFIIPQIILLILLSVQPIMVKLSRKNISGITRLLSRIYLFIAKKRGRRGKSSSPENFPNNLLNSKNEESSLFFWPLFSATQCFGLAFNIGILSILLFKVSATDLAFGWQTTLSLGAEKLQTIVTCLALPWSWLFQLQSYPSLEEIEGSRIVLKEGIYHLKTENLTAWWPFLSLSLITYGLLPRVILLFFSKILERVALSRQLKGDKFKSVLSRMRSPVLTTQADHEVKSQKSSELVPADSLERHVPTDTNQDIFFLIPEDIFPRVTEEDLDQLAGTMQGIYMSKKKIFGDSESDRTLLEELQHGKQGHFTRIIILTEAWMPPIQEFIDLLKDITVASDKKAPISLLLVGKPDKQTVMTQASPQNRKVWTASISRNCPSVIILD